MQDFITAKREEIAELCRTHHVKRLAVFGSAVRDDFDPQRSDVDLLVEFQSEGIDNFSDNFWDLLDAFQSLFGRRVDLVTSRSLINPFIIRSIRENQERLYAA
jgi:predicted nucleotidyltransferase